MALAMICTGAIAQKQTKTYKEEFKIEPNAVIDINTSYADIQFETWDKNEVVVEGTIELEGATEEEARAYFENSGIEILGNSKTVEIRTSGNSGWGRIAGAWPSAEMMELDFRIPDVDAIIHSIDIPEIPPMPEMPPLPPMPDFEFDYEAFKKDGEKYMKKWKKEFNKSFDKEYQEKMEAWGREFAARAEARKDLMEERREVMEEQRAEMREQNEQLREQAEQAREQAMKDRERAREEVRKVREQIRTEMRNSDESNFFFRSADGESKSYKVKKTIKIKMPKSAILKMNVRHGEVKLAANTRNIRATLSYARLHAASIEGNDTEINAAYTPVKVAQWKYGNLNTSFTDQVELDAVTDLNLNATSSEVKINKVLRNLISRNELGAIYISTVDPNFKKIDIEVRNGEFECVLPNTPFAVSVRNTQSDFNFPASWILKTTKDGPRVLYTGNSGKGNSDRVFKLNTAYSSVVLQ
ncbi:hypothetical protein GCM10011361_24800 [Muriicola marianensis]|uniref:Adhesin domain-containing protein n=1 Tax=Muriicola marianensis TaxID=1324801 RepID=A0ABQ1R7K0_9FLAO|nr:hypothetical protein GCM10011361_24800 [Muriicola marianensis]